MTGKRGSTISCRESGSRVSDDEKVVAELMTGERGSRVSDGEKG